MIYLNQILANPYLEEESVWSEILYLANLISDHCRSIDRGHRIWNNPICLVCQRASEFTQMQKTIRNWKQNMRSHWIQIRENGGILDFNFISLPNFTVDENGVCWHRLLEFVFGKWCCVWLWCSDLFKFFVNGKFTERFHFFVHG